MIISVLSSVLIFGALGLLGLMLARKIALPYSLILVLLGFIASFFTGLLQWDTGVRASNFQELMLFILLPVLIFEAAFSLDSQLFKKYLANTLTLATLGLIISSLITAVFLFYGIGHTGFPFIAALITGVVVSATDPVAVVNQLKALNAPKDLNVLIEGESLFNDATAIVLFSILLNIALGAAEASLGGAVLRFLLVFFGGILVGIGFGMLGALVARWVEAKTANRVLITLMLAYSSFYVGEHQFHVSGIVAVLFSALAFKHFSPDISNNEAHALHETWQSLGFLANVFVFVLLGLVITLEMFSERWLAMILAVAGALIARVVAVYISNWLNAVTVGQRVDVRYAPVMIWGGLRGAVTIALVLSLPTELSYWWTIQSIGFGVVLFTLVVQATTNPWLVKKLKL